MSTQTDNGDADDDAALLAALNHIANSGNKPSSPDIDTTRPPHTPTPWFIDRDRDGFAWTDSHSIGWIDETGRGSGGHICHMTRGRYGLANAEHIVRCVNVHDELVAALRKIADRDMTASHMPPGVSPELAAAMAFDADKWIARAALAKVTP